MVKRPTVTTIFGPRRTAVESAALVEQKLDEVLRRRTGPPPTPIPLRPPPAPPPPRSLAITVDDEEMQRPAPWLQPVPQR